MRLIPPHNDKLVPTKSKLQKLLFKFYNKNYESCLYHELIQESVRTLLSLTINEEDVDLVEKHTREQAKSDLWFQARAGVITACKSVILKKINFQLRQQDLVVTMKN